MSQANGCNSMDQVSNSSYYSKISAQSKSTFIYQGTKSNQDRAMLDAHSSSLCQNCRKLLCREEKTLLKSIMKVTIFYEFTNIYSCTFKGNSYLQSSLKIYWAFFPWVLLRSQALFLSGLFWLCQKTHTLCYKYWMQVIS